VQSSTGTQGCKREDLFEDGLRDFFPIIISIETIYPENYKGRGKKNIQYTYGSFIRDDEKERTDLRPVDNMRYKFTK